ncbi:hypothetical protein PAXINDRAFT_22220 [Paxillus involutus ATCC 200175]|uniref:Uncharacterized protein n=1 Tax=Paxillus involutus ATCC 200175 TaxID=664439 RepID=A0A0C9TB39_PAXIN|nr:hypothetical protein PAXINDRAFT_22220 [Paxillus involutus ATCC 200175]
MREDLELEARRAALKRKSEEITNASGSDEEELMSDNCMKPPSRKQRKTDAISQSSDESDDGHAETSEDHKKVKKGHNSDKKQKTRKKHQQVESSDDSESDDGHTETVIQSRKPEECKKVKEGHDSNKKKQKSHKKHQQIESSDDSESDDGHAETVIQSQKSKDRKNVNGDLGGLLSAPRTITPAATATSANPADLFKGSPLKSQAGDASNIGDIDAISGPVLQGRDSSSAPPQLRAALTQYEKLYREKGHDPALRLGIEICILINNERKKVGAITLATKRGWPVTSIDFKEIPGRVIAMLRELKEIVFDRDA